MSPSDSEAADLPAFLGARLRRFPVHAVRDEIGIIVAVDVESGIVVRLLREQGVSERSRDGIAQAYVQALNDRFAQEGKWQPPPDGLVAEVHTSRGRVRAWLVDAWEIARHHVFVPLSAWVENRRMSLRRPRWRRRLGEG